MPMLKVGELVKLNSGGELMTVKSHDADGVCTTWFSPEGLLQEGHFSVELLKVYQDEPSSFEPNFQL